MGNGIYTYHGDQSRFAEALADFKQGNQNLTVTAVAPLIINVGVSGVTACGYVVNTEEKK